MIQVSQLTKAYGKQVLFENVTFSLMRGDRVGLVGRNGHGKSTLFRLILGEEDADSGEITAPDGYRVGHLSQHIRFSKPTVVEEGCLGLASDDGWHETHRVEAVLLGLGFSKEQFEQNPAELSGGLQVRLNLVKLLVSQPNLLLLDEPTNYLDIVSMRWLQRFLVSWSGEFMLITHDRGFMDSVTTHTLGIHRGKARKMEGGTEKFFEQLAIEESVYEQTRQNQEKKVRHQEAFIERFRAKASKAKAVQSRIKAVEKMEVLEKLSEIEGLDFNFSTAPFPGKWLMEIKDVSFGYDSEKELLIEGLSISVGKTDRIGVIGKNGKGKSTLLNLIAGGLAPSSGSIVASGNLALGYFGQTNVERLNQNYTIEEELLKVRVVENRTLARSIAGLMMFEGDLALKKIRVLSGGEKSRVLLGKILLTPSNLLLLDEPSNHLDLEANTALLDALEAFPGGVMLVTHSEQMLKQLANRLIIFDGGTVSVFEGTYQDFLDRTGWQDEIREKENEPAAKSNGSKNLGKKELRRLRADVISRRSRALNPLKQEIARIEKEIEALEVTVNADSSQLAELSKDGFGDQAASLSRTLHKSKAKIDDLFDKLHRHTQELQEKEAAFTEELEGIAS